MDHTLLVRLRTFNELKRGEHVRVPYCDSTKRPEVGDVVVVRARGHEECEECNNEALRAAVISVESDDAVTTTLERTD